MKIISALLLPLALCAVASAQEDPKDIQGVVKLLQDLLEQSKADALNDRNNFARTQCQCEDKKVSLEDSIKEQSELITENEGLIEEHRGANGEDSVSYREAVDKKDETEATRDTAIALRKKEKQAYDDLQANLKESIKDMKDAIEMLAEVGGDQTKSTGADHTQYMADFPKESFLQKRRPKADALKILKVVTALANPVQARKLTAFIQAPFTGTYTSQSGEIVGILKNMLDTFEQNKKDSTERENNAVEAHKKNLKTWKDIIDTLEDQIGDLSTAMGEADTGLTTARKDLKAAQEMLAQHQEDLQYNEDVCSAQQKAYDARVLSRTNEQAALSQAISILNTDEAFSVTRDEVVQTTSGSGASFLQLSSSVTNALHKVAVESHSARVASMIKLIRAMQPKATKDVSGKNPFKTIMVKIDELLLVIKKEHAADQKQFDWCADEQKTNNDEIDNVLKPEITSLEGAINDDNKNIKSTKASIDTMEKDYKDSQEERKTLTENRIKDNGDYREHVQKTSLANSLISKALSTLEAYYNKEEGDSWKVSAKTEDDGENSESRRSSESTWAEDKDTARQDTSSIISLLTSLKSGTATEEATAHEEEQAAQSLYECQTNKHLKHEKELGAEIADAEEALAKHEKSLLKHTEQLAATEKEKADTETYLAKIKPGCDFIQENKKERDSSRDAEKKALNEAKKILQDSDVFKNAERSQEVEDFGACAGWKDEDANLGNCEENKSNAACKACLAGVTVPGYCAGHADAEGC